MSTATGSYTLPSIITTALIVVTVIFPLLATVAIALRFYARGVAKKGAYAEDWVILIALILTWAMSVNVWISGSFIGINTYKGDNPITAAELSVRTTWIDGFMLGVTLALTKISILLFYRGIFVMRAFRITCWVFIVMIACWATSTVFTQLFMATPITDAWNVTVDHYNIDYDSFYLAVAGMSLCFDVIVLCFPIPVILRLQMPTSRKIHVVMIFWLGAFCCISAAIRFYYLYHEIYQETVGNGDSQFAAITTGFLWAKVECACSIIAACLPTLGPLFGRKTSFFSTLRSFFSLRSTNVSADASSETLGSMDKDRLTGSGMHGVELSSRTWVAKGHGYEDLERGERRQGPNGEILVSKTIAQDVE